MSFWDKSKQEIYLLIISWGGELSDEVGVIPTIFVAFGLLNSFWRGWWKKCACEWCLNNWLRRKKHHTEGIVLKIVPEILKEILCCLFREGWGSKSLKNFAENAVCKWTYLHLFRMFYGLFCLKLTKYIAITNLQCLNTEMITSTELW